MGESLRDQLVKAGLATGAQAKKAERQQRAEAQAKKRGGKQRQKSSVEPTEQDKVRARAKDQQARKAARDRELAQQRNEKYAAKALRAELKQLILQNDQRVKAPDDDAHPYNFVHGKRIKKLYVTQQQLQALSSGQLIIVNNDGNYHFLLPKVADKVAQRDPKRIIVAHNKESEPPSEDDEYYAKFKVPDDLDW
ncbi:MAG: DUF2058 domain-containing protein [Pseudomonadota bacterium]